MNSALYTGTVVHARREPAEHVFRYRVCSFALDLDELHELDRTLRLFSYNRANVFSIRDRDHLGRAGQPLATRVRSWLAERDVDVAGGRIVLLTNLRVLGYVFNPVSFFYCYAQDGGLAAIVAEVSNTFGERWPYLLLRRDGEELTFRTDKRLHVSPFFGLDQEYRFAFAEPGEHVWARIDVYEHGERRFGSVLAGERRELTNANLARALLRYGPLPARVTRAIHWQALRLWTKRVPFHHKPSPPPGAMAIPHAIPFPRSTRTRP